MVDLSEESLDENIGECARLLKRMAAIDMSIEIELGCTGGEEDGVGSDDVDNARLYTQPEDVLKAYEVLSPIGNFSVAASFGNVHGVYAPGNVQLRPEILRNSQALVQKSPKARGRTRLTSSSTAGRGRIKGRSPKRSAMACSKMNIDTDTQFAFAHAIGDYVKQNANAFSYQIDPDSGKPYKKEYDPRTWLRVGEKGIVERLGEAFTDLRSAGKSVATPKADSKAA
jgi:fructose-bisphosphate aldolase class II